MSAAYRPSVALPTVEPYRSTPWTAFGALMLRDLTVLRKNFVEFVLRTVMQPLLFVFVFTYVFPQIGQGVGGAQGQAEFASILVAGVIAIACIFQGIQAVALPLVQDFGYTREIEDRVQAPLPVSLLAVEKAVAGAVNGLFAAVLVFPIAAIVPATPVNLDVNWPELLTIVPIGCYMCGALGLTFGTRFEPRTVPMLFGIFVLPMTFLGAVYYSWSTLEPVRWVQILVLANPLVYLCEGLRASLTTSPHMSLWAVYPAMLGFSVLFTWLGINGFKKRVLT